MARSGTDVAPQVPWRCLVSSDNRSGGGPRRSAALRPGDFEHAQVGLECRHARFKIWRCNTSFDFNANELINRPTSQPVQLRNNVEARIFNEPTPQAPQRIRRYTYLFGNAVNGPPRPREDLLHAFSDGVHDYIPLHSLDFSFRFANV